jgi:hypothetical protein
MAVTLTPPATPTVATEADPEDTPFTEAQMDAIDRAVVRVYTRSRAVLPPDLLSERSNDPAAALRSVAYGYAHSHRAEIEGRSPGRVFHHVRTRLQQHVKRELRRHPERPYGIGTEYMEAVAPRAASDRLRIVKSPPAVDSDAHCLSLTKYGRILPPDQLPFMVKGRQDGRPMLEDRAVIDRLHTRRPTRAEYWDGVLNGNTRRTARADLARDTGLHANTVDAIVEDVAPAERYSLEACPTDRADVDRERHRITSEEVKRVLLERFDVLYDD